MPGKARATSRRRDSTRRSTASRSQNDNSPDYILIILVGILTLVGAIVVYSGSVLVAVKLGFSPYHYFVRQLIWILIGSVAAFILSRIHYKQLAKLAAPGLLVAILLLIMVLAINWQNDIKRWISLGPFDFQPSELAKLIFFVYLAAWLAKFKEKAGDMREKFAHHFTYELLPFLLILALVCLPILVQPDLDTTIIIAATSFITYFIAGSDMIHTLTSTSLGGIFLILGYMLTQVADYRLSRITNWLEFWATNEIQNPFGAGYQLRQLLVAVASGGLFGLGFGESRQKFHYLGDTAFTDTVFAIFAEEFGLIGSIALISAFIYFFLRGFKIAKGAPDKLGYLLAIAITTWLTLQAFFHIASNVALIPINGNTLPFISYGGSSTIINLAAIGILLNISRYSKYEK